MSGLDRKLSAALSEHSEGKQGRRRKVRSESQLISSLEEAFKEKKEQSDSLGEQGNSGDRLQELVEILGGEKEGEEKASQDGISKAGTIEKGNAEERLEVRGQYGSGSQEPSPEKPSLKPEETRESSASHTTGTSGSTAFRYGRGRARRKAEERSNGMMGVILSVFLIVLGLSGALVAPSCSNRLLGIAVDKSGCVAAFEEEFLDSVNGWLEEQGLALRLSPEAMVDGSSVLDIKNALTSVQKGESYAPNSDLMAGKLQRYMETADPSMAAETRQAVADRVVSQYGEMMDGIGASFSFLGRRDYRLASMGVLVVSAALVLTIMLRMRINSAWGGRMLAEKLSFFLSAGLILIASVAVLFTKFYAEIAFSHVFMGLIFEGICVAALVCAMVFAAMYAVVGIQLMMYTASSKE